MTGRMEMSGEAQGCWKRDGQSLAVRANKRNGKEVNALEKKKRTQASSVHRFSRPVASWPASAVVWPAG